MHYPLTIPFSPWRLSLIGVWCFALPLWLGVTTSPANAAPPQTSSSQPLPKLRPIPSRPIAQRQKTKAEPNTPPNKRSTILIKRPFKKKKKKKKKRDPNRYELGILPAVNYSIDTGFGFGVIGALAKFAPGYSPYQWRLSFLLYATVQSTGAGVEFPFHDDYLNLDMPGLAGGRVRLSMRLGFSRFTTAGYYGLGNASENKTPWEKFDPETQKEEYLNARRYQQYDRIYPSYRANARIMLRKRKNNRLELFVGGRITYNWINIYKNSKLEEDAAGQVGPFVKNSLIGLSPHLQTVGNIGIIWDTRNHEFTPRIGFFNEISARFGGGIGAPFSYGGVNANFRLFLPIVGDFLVLAVRVIGDMLFGNVPFFELARFGGLFPGDATGGGGSIRGVAALRYHGKAKVLGNLELRAKLIPFQVAGQRFNFGLIGFVDAGRVWADYFIRDPNVGQTLDGTELGLKYGVGGGIRLQWGETFIVRLDLAQSLSDDRFGFYLNINHIF